jgi:hypothetical protein
MVPHLRMPCTSIRFARHSFFGVTRDKKNENFMEKKKRLSDAQTLT